MTVQGVVLITKAKQGFGDIVRYDVSASDGILVHRAPQQAQEIFFEEWHLIVSQIRHRQARQHARAMTRLRAEQYRMRRLNKRKYNRIEAPLKNAAR